MTMIHDSGSRRTFATGANRDRALNKVRPDLIPAPFRLFMGHLLAAGAIKYDARNFEKGMPVSEILASLHRHLVKYELGMDDEPHAVQIAFGAMQLAYQAVMAQAGNPIFAELDDRPWYNGNWRAVLDSFESALQAMADAKEQTGG